MRHSLYLWCGCITLGSLIGGCNQSSAPNPGPPESFRQVEDFSFINQNGKAVSRADLRGKVWVAGFIFTRCPGPCAQISGNMARLQHDLADRKDVLLVSFTVDPDFDTPAVLKAYAATYGADSRRWYFLTGAKDKLYHLIRHGFQLGVPGQGEMTHSVKLMLVDGAGNIRARFDGTNPEDVKRLEKAVADLAGGPP